MKTDKVLKFKTFFFRQPALLQKKYFYFRKYILMIKIFYVQFNKLICLQSNIPSKCII